MTRKIYAADQEICLGEYLPRDCEADFQDWQDEETQRGYNFRPERTLAEFQSRPLRHRLYAVILRETEPETPLGIIMVSPPPGEADLAIRVYAPYRGQGIGTAAFGLAARYAVECLRVETLHAGCYEGNERSRQMLLRCALCGSRREIWMSAII